MESASNVGYGRPIEQGEPPAKASHRRFSRGRIVRFCAVVTGLIAACNWFVGATWAHFSGESDLAWRMAFMLVALAFVPVTLIGRFWRNPLLKPLSLSSSVAVGALNFAIFAAAGTWITVGIARFFGVPVESRSIVCAFYGVAAFVTIYGLVNAAWLRVTPVTIALPNLPPDWEGRTAALVTDLHLGNIHGVGYARHVVARLAALNPDAVFIAGDLFDGASIDHAAAVAPLSKLAAPLGVYFVTGNHDEYAYRGAILAAVRSAGIRVLDNAKVDLEGLQIVGVHDADASDPRRFGEIISRVRVNRETPSILINHQPANLVAAEEAGFSLQLSGHTHAGQFWPWSALVRRIFGPFAYGLHHFKSLLVLTSSGVGTWGPPLRVGTRSEIVLITFGCSPREVKPS
jgi:predicted MPP superfamily phosphohydrolase